ncbi:hypothetical protein QBC46DRAFT_288823, partial [Diplogelasinospora grovesii]
MATTNKPSELRFVVKTGLGAFNPEDRKLIRSHVMKGRNLGKERPLGSRRRSRCADVSQQILPSPSSSNSSSSDRGCDGSFSPQSSSVATTPSSEHSPVNHTLATAPRKFGSVASTICLADSVRPATINVVLQFSSIAKQLLFPMETCIFFERRAENWIAPLAVDPAFLHAKIFTSLYYFDVILSRTSSGPTQRILHHHHKALSLLRERLLSGDDDARLSNNTVSIVLGLAGQAFWTGDVRSAINHMEGIRRIVHLRGGLRTFSGNEKLSVEILRCDLGIAVHNGSKPLFFDGTSLSEPILPHLDLTLFLDKRNPSFATNSSWRADSATLTSDIGIDDDLALAWRAMSDFCSVINFAADSEQRITVGTFLETMTAIMYRLLHMHFEASSRDETIRLGLLCFSCSVFLHWQHLGMSYVHLASMFRGCLTRLTSTSSHLPPQLILWLLMAGAVSVFDESDDAWFNPMLRGTMSMCDVGSWGEMRELLMSFMWIGLVHDKRGKRMFDSCYNSHPSH